MAEIMASAMPENLKALSSQRSCQLTYRCPTSRGTHFGRSITEINHRCVPFHCSIFYTTLTSLPNRVGRVGACVSGRCLIRHHVSYSALITHLVAPHLLGLCCYSRLPGLLAGVLTILPGTARSRIVQLSCRCPRWCSFRNMPPRPAIRKPTTSG